MNLKNIIKFLLISASLFLFSCQKLEKFRNQDEKISLTIKDEIENLETINNLSNNQKNYYFDHYSKSVNFLWKNEQELKKIFTINNSFKKNPDAPYLKVNIINDKVNNLDDIYYIYKSILI